MARHSSELKRGSDSARGVLQVPPSLSFDDAGTFGSHGVALLRRALCSLPALAARHTFPPRGPHSSELSAVTVDAGKHHDADMIKKRRFNPSPARQLFPPGGRVNVARSR